MGKGIIKSNLGDGAYSVELTLDRTRIDAAIAKLESEIADLNTLYGEEFDQEKSDILFLKITSLEKRKSFLENNMPEDPTVSAWCADLSESLTGTVATIEVPGERGTIQVRGGYDGAAVYSSERDGQLQPSVAGTPESVFYNLSMLAGWQKFKPTFRHGTITSIDTETDLCDITLESVTSSAQALFINQTDTLDDVPIEYMNCNSAAFEEGDAVLIEFTGQDWENPKVVGFKTDPKPCGLGYLYTCGKNTDGQLGLGDNINRNEFTQVGEYSEYIKCFAGQQYSFVVDTDGALFGCGDNGYHGSFESLRYSPLGIIGDEEILTFTETITGISEADGGLYHTVVIKNDGSIHSVGKQYRGQLATGERDTYYRSWQSVGTGFNKVACGSQHSLATKTDGSLWGAGYNAQGQLGLGSDSADDYNVNWRDLDISNVIQISSNEYLSMVLTSSGTIYGTGSNNLGQLGIGSTTDVDVWTECGSDFIFISCSAQHSAAIKTNGDLYVTGNNNYGQLGLNDTTNRDTWTYVMSGVDQI
ncbi:MAG: hypothetical protein DRH26_06785, partial [Deltaproteobacteria bacterium]